MPQTNLALGAAWAHAEEAAGVVDVGVGGHDVGEFGGVEVDGLEVGEDVFFGDAGFAGVHEHGEILAQEKVELQRAAVVKLTGIWWTPGRISGMWPPDAGTIK